MTKDEVVGWHQLNGHEFEQAAGVGEKAGNLVCCSPWGSKELDTTEGGTEKQIGIKYNLFRLHTQFHSSIYRSWLPINQSKGLLMYLELITHLSTVRISEQGFYPKQVCKRWCRGCGEGQQHLNTRGAALQVLHEAVSFSVLL